MGLFWSDSGSKPRVSELEWKKNIRPALSQKGFTLKEVNQIEGYILGDMYEGRPMDNGLDKDEIVQKINWFRRNKSLHTLSDSQISILESELMKYL
jgi:hypothetical protein